MNSTHQSHVDQMQPQLLVVEKELLTMRIVKAARGNPP